MSGNKSEGAEAGRMLRDATDWEAMMATWREVQRMGEESRERAKAWAEGAGYAPVLPRELREVKP